jgi:hypothetical protein
MPRDVRQRESIHLDAWCPGRKGNLMKVVASLSVERIQGEPSPYWPPGTKRLIVIVSESRRGDGTLVAHGVDPDAGHGHLVFETAVSRARLGAFVKALVDGDTPRAARGTSTDLTVERSVDTDETAVASRPDPDHPARAIALALAAAIDSDTELADATETAAASPALDEAI